MADKTAIEETVGGVAEEVELLEQKEEAAMSSTRSEEGDRGVDRDLLRSPENPENGEAAESSWKKYRWLAALAVAIVVILVIVIVVVVFKMTSSNSKLSYYDRPRKNIFSLQSVLESTSDTTSGVRGQLRVCGQDGCCVTEGFLFAVPTMIYPGENKSNCSSFTVHKDKIITVEVLNKDIEKVQVYQVRAVLEDGDNFKAMPAFCESGKWSNKFEMELFEPEKPETWAQIEIEVKLDEHTDKESFKNDIDTKISVRVPEDTRPHCTTNPLTDWQKVKNEMKGRSVTEMGTCYTYNIRNKNKNNRLQVMYNPPEDVPFKVKEIKLQSQRIRNYCWRVTINKTSNDWLETEFDDAC